MIIRFEKDREWVVGVLLDGIPIEAVPETEEVGDERDIELQRTYGIRWWHIVFILGP